MAPRPPARGRPPPRAAGIDFDQNSRPRRPLACGNQGAGNESQTIRIGTAQTQTSRAGIAGIPIANAPPMEIDISTGQLGTGSLLVATGNLCARTD